MFTVTNKSVFETPHFTDRERKRPRKSNDLEVAQSAFNLIPCKTTNPLLGGVRLTDLKKASPLNTEKLLRGVVQQVGSGNKITPSQVISGAIPSVSKSKVYNVFTGPVKGIIRSPLSGLLRSTP